MSFTGAGNTGHNLEAILRDQAGHAVLETHVGYVHLYLCPKGGCLLDVSPGLKGKHLDSLLQDFVCLIH